MVSVCIATYNGEKFIKEQIESILVQLQDNDEIIISDDSSTDRTMQIIKSINDERIKFYTNEKSSGRPTENFENALRKSSGQFIFLADQDDVWLDHKYLKVKKLLESYELVLTNSILVDEDLKELNPSFFKFHGSRTGILKNVIKNSYFGSCMAFRKVLLEYALPFPRSREIGHDVWLGLVAEIVGKVYLTDDPLILYRRHLSAVTSHGIGKSKRGLYIKILGRVIMLKFVLIFYVKYLFKWKKD